jgi:hypothetical protein
VSHRGKDPLRLACPFGAPKAGFIPTTLVVGQWYCRYFRGRRMEDDARQIGRWKAVRRHVRQIERACEKGDLFCRPRQRQAVLHWAYDSRII